MPMPKTNATQLDQLISTAQSLYPDEDPAHDWAHVLRVFNNAKLIGESEKARMNILLPAALLHDLINLPKNHPERERASQYSAEKAHDVLTPLGYSDSEILSISKAIEEHSYSRGQTPSTLEGAILQDSDRLDAIGAIGVMRCISTGTQMKSKFFNPKMISAWQVSQETPYELNDKIYMIDHFYKKLLKLRVGFNTATARRLAEKRSQFLILFLDQLKSELTPAKT